MADDTPPVNPPIQANPVTLARAFTILQAVDNRADQVVTVNIYLTVAGRTDVQEWITVWAGQAYIDAGEWTDTQLNAAVLALVNAMS